MPLGFRKIGFRDWPKSPDRPRAGASEVSETAQRSPMPLLWRSKMEASEATLDPFRTVSPDNTVDSPLSKSIEGLKVTSWQCERTYRHFGVGERNRPYVCGEAPPGHYV